VTRFTEDKFVAPAGGAGATGTGQSDAQGGRSIQPSAAHRDLAGRGPSRHADHHGAPAYAALDLGTNNCRLLVARPSRRNFLVIDAFSRIIRLGEGVSVNGRLSDEAMTRTLDALRICSAKLAKARVVRSRLVATEACRIASNGRMFLDRVHRELGLNIEVLTRETEAKLAVSGCAALIDPEAELALVFDIGGGSSELIWLDLSKRRGAWRHSLTERVEAQNCIAAWTSLPVGVVTLAERYGGRQVTAQSFETMVDHAQQIVRSLLDRSYEERVAEPCIGRDRADLVLAGCAILEALLRTWPCERIRVADRGLREGILATLMAEDGVYRGGRRHGGQHRP
jgi:exopolyphosphatase/guanosine-5'-triphosphate,3'-diphosphate pyrophosphatase